MIIPQIGTDEVLKAIKKAKFDQRTKLDGIKQVAIDHYIFDPEQVTAAIELWFKKEVFKQIPVYPQKTVPRFARARMMLYKKPPQRNLATDKKSKDYKNICYKLDSKMRQFAEMTWLLKDCLLYSFFNELKERLEYKIVPIFTEYFLENDPNNVWGYHYELNPIIQDVRRFAFWSETRDGIPGDHFVFNERGTIEPNEKNPDNKNPYGILPFTQVNYTSSAFDVVDTAIQIGIGMTQIALGGRFNLGTWWTDGNFDQKKPIDYGLTSIIQVPQGTTMGQIGMSGTLTENIESIRAFANMTAENNHLRIRWGEEGGSPPSGNSLRILEIENIDSRESDIPIWREGEEDRFKVDSTIIEVHGKGNFGDKYSVDFEEIQFPQTIEEKQKEWDWDILKGHKSSAQILMERNPDRFKTEEEAVEEIDKNLEANRQEPKTKPKTGLGIFDSEDENELNA